MCLGQTSFEVHRGRVFIRRFIEPDSINTTLSPYIEFFSSFFFCSIFRVVLGSDLYIIHIYMYILYAYIIIYVYRSRNFEHNKNMFTLSVLRLYTKFQGHADDNILIL